MNKCLLLQADRYNGRMPEKKPLEKYMEAGKEFATSRKRVQKDWRRTISRGRAKPGASMQRIGQTNSSGAAAGAQSSSPILFARRSREQIKQFNLATNQDVIKVVQQFIERTTKAAAPVMEAATRTVTATKKAAKGKSST